MKARKTLGGRSGWARGLALGFVVTSVAGIMALGGMALAAGPAAPLSTAGIVAFTGNNSDPGAWVIKPDGTGLQRLTPMGEKWIADDVSRGHVGMPVTVLAGTGGTSNRAQLYAVRADGTRAPVLIYQATEPARVHNARFSRDGTRIAFFGNNGVAPVVYTIYLADVARDVGGDVVGVNNVTVAYTTSSQLLRGLDFSRTGAEIVFSMTNDLWRLDLGTGVPTQLTNTAEVEAYPRWSSTDDRVVYEKWPNAAGSGNGGVICTLNVPSGAVTTITTKKNGGIAAAYLSYPCWSPDSAVVLYHAHDGSKSDLWQIASNGGGKGVNGTNNGVTVTENYPAWGW